MIKNLLFVFLLIFLFSCKTNPPNSPEDNTFYGNIVVTANVEGATIFVNDENSGKVTPDTLTLPIGQYIIKLMKTGYYCDSDTVLVEKDLTKNMELFMEVIDVQKVVLLEDFSNSSCIPCVESNSIIHTLQENSYANQLLVLKYSTNYPGPNDPFYLENSEENDVRLQYYNRFMAVPTVYIDGVLKPIPSDSNAIKNAIDDRLAIDPVFDIDLSTKIEENKYKVEVSLMPLILSEVDTENLVLHIAIIETDLHFEDPPGANGETEFYNVMRKMLPSCYGETLTDLVENEAKMFNYEYSLEGKNWVQNNLSVISFIQDVTTKEIYQAASDKN